MNTIFDFRNRRVVVLAVLFAGLGLTAGCGNSASQSTPIDDEAFLNEVREIKESTPDAEADAFAALPPADGDQSMVPEIHIGYDVLDMGLVSHAEITHQDLVITNRGKAPLVIKDIQTSCHCTEGHLDEANRTIFPGDSVTVDVTLNPFRISGFASDKVLTFMSNDPKTPHYQVKVVSKIDPEFSLEPEEFAFGAVERGEAASVTLRVRQHTEKPFEILDVNTVGGNKGMAAFTDIDLSFQKLPESEWRAPGKAEWDVTATLTPTIPPGELQRFVFIVTDLPRVPNLPVKLTGTVSSSIDIDPVYPRPLTLRKGNGPKEVMPAAATIRAQDMVEIINTEYDTSQLIVTPRAGENGQTMHLDVELAATAKEGALQEEVHFVVRSGGKDRNERILVRAFVPKGFGS